MYSWQHWLNHVTEYEDRYKETTNSDGTVTHTPVEGKVIQQGTPQDADNFNHMEDGISNAGETAALMAVNAIHMRQQIADMAGETMLRPLTYKFTSFTVSFCCRINGFYMQIRQRQ